MEFNILTSLSWSIILSAVINTVFDAVQLWGLRNFAKNLGIAKKNTSRLANEEQAISVATAGKSASEASKIASELIDKTPKYY
jgi:plasmid maintenance system antidote protein VapI